MQSVDIITASAIRFKLSLQDGVCCMVMLDYVTFEVRVQYFTSLVAALKYIDTLPATD